MYTWSENLPRWPISQIRHFGGRAHGKRAGVALFPRSAVTRRLIFSRLSTPATMDHCLC